MSGPISDTVQAKVCRKCGAAYEGRRCKPCWNSYIRAWNAANPEKVKASSDAYAAAHREESRIKARAWRLENLERARTNSAAWKAENPDKVKSAGAAAYRKNPDRVRLAFSGWAAANPEAKRLQVQNRRARKRANGGVLSKGLADKLMAAQKCQCIVCAGNLKELGYHLDHIIPVRDGGPNVDSNIQLLCPSCNHSKGAKNSIDFMQSRGFLL